MPTPCKIAFVGAGSMAPEHIKAFTDVPGVEIVGITNRTRDKAEVLAAEHGIPAVYDNIDEMYAATKADLAILSVYETAHRPVSENCFNYPWAVLMEKPVGLNLDEAVLIQKSAAEQDRQVWVGLNRRALSSTIAVLEDLADDPGPRFIHVQDQQSLDVANEIGHDPAVIKNWMYANSIHLVDYIPTLGRGAISEVTQVQPWDADNPGVVLAKIAFDSGDIGLYEGIWNGPGPWACTVSTPRRRWEMRPLETAVFQNAGERALNPVEQGAFDQSFKPGFRLQAERTVAAWRGEQSLQPTIDDAVGTMHLIHDIFGV